MSLTKELNNPTSPISKWFSNKYHQGVGNIILHHNQMMQRTPILKPISGTYFPLVGNAITYSLRQFIAAKQNNKSWVANTLAGKMANKLGIEKVAKFCSKNNNHLEENALKMLILGGLENYYRSSKTHEIIQPFLSRKNERLSLSQEYIERWLPSIQDVSQISAQLPHIWSSIEPMINLEKKTAISNATFTLSSLVHADCQLIIDNAIIDVRTTAKRQPFTLNNFYQQLSYLLFDSEDEYRLNKLTWIYTRQKVAFSYDVSQLFKDINSTRRDFKQMIECSYENSKFRYNNVTTLPNL